MREAAFIYDDALSRYVLREDHVLRPTRLQYTYELLQSYGAFSVPGSRLVAPEPASEADLLSFHTSEYVAAVKSFSRGERQYRPARFNFSQAGDNPIYPGMYETAALAAGASLKAAGLVAGGEFDVAFSPGGGMHHAAPDHASGFCVFNDAVIAIKRLLSLGLRVAYVDIDAHHGDGVQDAFYSTDRVLTISLHESGRYLFPGTGGTSEIGMAEGKGYSVNLPLAPYSDDEVYLRAFDQVVPALVGSFKTDVVVSQLGCDTHYLDPLTGLSLTTSGYAGLIARIRGLSPRWVALGGGGYDVGVVARSWTLAYGIMLDRVWPDEIPADYHERYGLKTLRDREGPSLDRPARERAQHFTEESVAGVKRLVFPLHGL